MASGFDFLKDILGNQQKLQSVDPTLVPETPPDGLLEQFKKSTNGQLPASNRELEDFSSKLKLEPMQDLNKSIIQDTLDRKKQFEMSNPAPIMGDLNKATSTEELNNILSDYQKNTSDYNKSLDSIKSNIPVNLDPSRLNVASPDLERRLASLSDASVGGDQTPSGSSDKKTSKLSSIASRSPSQSTQLPEEGIAQQSQIPAQNPLVDTQMEAALAEAKQNRETNQRRQALFQMMSGMGSLGGATVKGDNTALDNAIKMQNAPVDDLNTTRDQYKKMLANREEMEKADPNSAVSKTMRDALSGMGVKIPDTASYSTMEKLAPQLMANQQFKDRMEDRKLQREQMAQTKQLAGESKTTDKQNAFLQFATSKTAPIRAAYTTIQNAAKLASQKTNNPAEDITTLYSFVKNLDPNSSVREGEVGLARDIASVQGKVSTFFNKLQAGDSLDTKTVDNLKKEILRLAQAQKASYDTEMSAYKAGAKNRGIPEDRYNEFDPYGKTHEEEKSKVNSKDTQAIEWARANPKDPRSAEILKRNGVQ